MVAQTVPTIVIINLLTFQGYKKSKFPKNKSSVASGLCMLPCWAWLLVTKKREESIATGPKNQRRNQASIGEKSLIRCI